MLKIRGLKDKRSQLALLDYAYNVIVEGNTFEELEKKTKLPIGKKAFRLLKLKVNEAILIWIPSVGVPPLFLEEVRSAHWGVVHKEEALFVIRNSQHNVIAFCSKRQMESSVQENSKTRSIWPRTREENFMASQIFA